jgi:hypothetical protein
MKKVDKIEIKYKLINQPSLFSIAQNPLIYMFNNLMSNHLATFQSVCLMSKQLIHLAQINQFPAFQID